MTILNIFFTIFVEKLKAETSLSTLIKKNQKSKY